MVTSNHIDLLVFDNAGRNVIPDSIKLIAGRVAQEYNIRKKRKGAFWEDANKWVDNAIQPEADSSIKENKWTQSIAVGSKAFIEKIKEALGYRAIGRRIFGDEESFVLREGQTPYGEPNDLYPENTFLWDQTPSSLTGQFLFKN